MACVTYDMTCRNCGHHDIFNKRPSECDNCGGTKLNIVKEFDEWQDHREDN